MPNSDPIRSPLRSYRTFTFLAGLVLLPLIGLWTAAPWIAQAGSTEPSYALFSQTNLVAWCIVPFDSRKRRPEERAAMLEKLGFRQFAYHYRAEHVPSFDTEMEAFLWEARRLRTQTTGRQYIVIPATAGRN